MVRTAANLLAILLLAANLLANICWLKIAFGLIHVCSSVLEWPGKGPLFESDSNKRRGVKMESLFKSPPRPLLKSGLQPFARYGTQPIRKP